jgi:hypothetical protein
MEPLCHRCGSSLASPETFCPNCGAPQLRLEESVEEPRPGTMERPGQTLDPRGITWKSAVGAAIAVAVPVGVLSSQLSGACCLWGIGGSIAAVALYRRRSAVVLLDVTTGMRIGLIVGVLASFCSSATNGAWLLVQRFILHDGAVMDKGWQTQMEQASQATSQFFPQLPQQASQASMRFWMTADGRAAGVLLNALLFSAGMLLFSTIGGALGARIFTARNRALKNP